MLPNSCLTFIIFRASLVLAVTFTNQIAMAQDADGPLVVSSNGHWFEYRDSGKPFFMAGSGGPEGFFYETDARKQTIVDDLIATGANALYVHTIRSFEGDGYSFEDPFNTNEDINSGVNDQVLDNWLGYLTQLDNNQIVSWIHIIDDTARPWGCINNIEDLPAAAESYVETIVKKFRHLDHLVWLSGEEYLMGNCSDAQDDTLMSAIAAEIRKHDSVHPIGVHHNNGQAMQFANDPNVDVYAQQACGDPSINNPDQMHTVTDFNNSYVYVMAECYPWHQQLIEQESTDAAESRELLRQSNWASAMGGGYLLIYDAYECQTPSCTRNSSGTVITTPDINGEVRVATDDPSLDMLRDMARLSQFMTDSDFHLLTPNDSLATGDADWVMANTNIETFIVYSNDTPNTMGVENLFADAVYDLRWFNPETGEVVLQQLNGSASPFAVPNPFGEEVALSIKLNDAGNTNRSPIANDDDYEVLPGESLTVIVSNGVLKNDSDFENDNLTVELLTDTNNGQLNLNNNGSFSYQPNVNFEGVDLFTYRVSDGNSNSNAATVQINVNNMPGVQLWLIDANSNTRVRRLASNDVINMNSIGFSLFSIEAEFSGSGSIEFDYSGIYSGNRTESVAPYAIFGDDTGNFEGMTVLAGSFTVSASSWSGTNANGNLLGDTNITFNFSDAVANQAPNAIADRYNVLVNSAINVSATLGVLVNDTDPDGDPLSAILVDDVDHGTLTLNADGSFSYSPNMDFVGTDSFTYKAKDVTLESTTTLVQLFVAESFALADEEFCFTIPINSSKMVVICL